MMDLGATLCTPRRPSCALCPWRSCCAAFASGRADRFPMSAAKPERPQRFGVAFWLTRGDGWVLLRRRPERGLLGGMIEIPSTDWRAEPWTLDEALPRAPVAAQWSLLPGAVRHGFTHFRLDLAIATARTAVAVDGIWSAVERLGEHALPTLMKKVVGHATAALGTAAPTRTAERPQLRLPG
jgi:A/G-specific adenine glycosylase